MQAGILLPILQIQIFCLILIDFARSVSCYPPMDYWLCKTENTGQGNELANNFGWAIEFFCKKKKKIFVSEGATVLLKHENQ